MTESDEEPLREVFRRAAGAPATERLPRTGAELRSSVASRRKGPSGGGLARKGLIGLLVLALVGGATFAAVNASTGAPPRSSPAAGVSGPATTTPLSSTVVTGPSGTSPPVTTNPSTTTTTAVTTSTVPTTTTTAAPAGCSASSYVGDQSQPASSLTACPDAGPVGTVVTLSGSGCTFQGREVILEFYGTTEYPGSGGGGTAITTQPNAQGHFSTTFTIPSSVMKGGAPPGPVSNVPDGPGQVSFSSAPSLQGCLVYFTITTG
jgi:hypothetical protein